MFQVSEVSHHWLQVVKVRFEDKLGRKLLLQSRLEGSCLSSYKYLLTSSVGLLLYKENMQKLMSKFVASGVYIIPSICSYYVY